MSGKRRCKRTGGTLAAVCVAFGVGLLISCVFSLKLAVIVAAVLLVWLGCAAG